MAVLPIVCWPDARLRAETVPISTITDEIRSLYNDLRDTMFAQNAVGIAAIQVGDNRKMFLIDGHVAGGEPDSRPLAFINPQILELSDQTKVDDEGCLSFPGIYIPVKRSYHAKVRATNMDGEPFVLEGEALLARAIQHEYDHLTGQLLADFVGPLKKQMMKRKLQKLAKKNPSDTEVSHL